jgi:N utilization substance protein B
MSGSNLSGNQKRRMKSASRLYAVQALFQMEASKLPIDVVSKEFEEHRMGVELDGVQLADGDIAHFNQVIAGAVNNQARIDQMTDRALVAKWPIARLDPDIAGPVPRGGGGVCRGRHAAKSGDRGIC